MTESNKDNDSNQKNMLTGKEVLAIVQNDQKCIQNIYDHILDTEGQLIKENGGTRPDNHFWSTLEDLKNQILGADRKNQKILKKGK